MRMVVAVADAGTTGALTARIELRTASGRFVSREAPRSSPAPCARSPSAASRRGRYRVRIDLRDRAGNPATVTRTIRIR